MVESLILRKIKEYRLGEEEEVYKCEQDSEVLVQQRQP